MTRMYKMTPGKIAFWLIANHKGEQHLLLPYDQKLVAESLLNDLNKDRKKEFFYVQLVKKPMVELPCQFVNVAMNDRTIQIPFKRKNGEEGITRRRFRDIQVTELINGRHTIVEELTAHLHRGEVRVQWKGNSLSFDIFKIVALNRWDNDAEKILTLIRGV